MTQHSMRPPFENQYADADKDPIVEYIEAVKKGYEK